METTREGQVINFTIRAMSWLKGKERGIEVIEGATKDSVFDDKMEIKAQEGSLRSNDTIETESGKIIKFKDNSFNRVKHNREVRKIESTEREIG